MKEMERERESLERRRAESGPPAARVSVRERAEVEQSLEQLSRWMDGLFRVPGTSWRFGLDAIVGLVPGVGDTMTTLVSFYVLAAGVRYRVPKVTLLRMAANVGVDYVLGAVPFLGDLFDFAWKSNQKNVELLRQRASVSPEEARTGRASDWLFVGLLMLVLLALLVGSITIAWYILRLVFEQLPSLF